MDSVMSTITRLVWNDDGQDLLEYGLLGVLIAVVVTAGVTIMGQKIYSVFWQVIGHAV